MVRAKSRPVSLLATRAAAATLPHAGVAADCLFQAILLRATLLQATLLQATDTRGRGSGEYRICPHAQNMMRFFYVQGSTRLRGAALCLTHGLVACLVVASLPGCSSAPVPVATVDEGAVARYRASGYALPAAAPIEAHRISGPVTEAPWTISLTRPADHQVRPLIIFLPSLGEDDTAPVRWIETWAHAGYAVLVIQALRDDANVWSTPDARSGDFERIARARFADDLMADRIAQLARLLNQIRTRSLRGEAGLDGLDWSHLALAGADLGGYTVQCIATSTPAALSAAHWPLTPQAYLVISPYALRNRPATPAVPPAAPVLMISARDDVDAYGVVTDAAVRRLAFDRLGSGDDTYFELGSATHRWLGGAVVLSAVPEATPRPRPLAADEGPAGPGGRGRNAGHGHDEMAPEREDAESVADRKARAASRAERVAAASRTLTQSALTVVSFEAVTIAYLDAWLRDRPAARDWLTKSAPRWLQDGDRLKHR